MDARSSEAARCKVVPVRTVDGQSTEVLISASSTVAQLKALVVNKLAWPSTPLQVHLILRVRDGDVFALARQLVLSRHELSWCVVGMLQM